MDWLLLPSSPGVLAISSLALAVLWDRFLGEPPNHWHPVVWMGNAIAWLRDAFEPYPKLHLLLGAVLALSVPFAAYLSGGLVTDWPWWLQLPAQVFLLKSTFSLWTLLGAASDMHGLLGTGRLVDARKQLSWLCSRDPSALNSQELATASIESVAENLSDSLVAPLFYYALLGLPGALAYRAINTADAMVGYRGRYEYLGKAAARLDDLANYLPARITGSALLLAGLCRGAPTGRAAATWRRDGGRTASPNAGIPMATMAGLLGVRLDKKGHYCLGAALAPVECDHIQDAITLAARAGQLAIAGGLLALWYFH